MIDHFHCHCDCHSHVYYVTCGSFCLSSCHCHVSFFYLLIFFESVCSRKSLDLFFLYMYFVV